MKIKKQGKILKFITFFVIFTIVLFVSSILIIKKLVFPLKHFDVVKIEASKNNIDPYLIMAIIKTESNFNKEATSNKKAKGLMQIRDTTANDINNKINLVNQVEGNLFDENVNIALGCKYFNDLISNYNGNYYLAICAYNAGMGNVNKWIEEGKVDKNLNEYTNISLPFEETRKYLKKVIISYKIYRKLYS